MLDNRQGADALVKQCCAAFYGSEFARLLLGDSFHPGGTKLTRELGEYLALNSTSAVLDVASGRGTTALYVAETFGCEVVGIDISEENVRLSRESAHSRGVADRVRFEISDAESLSFPDASFDAILCECAFCTFPDKARAARGFRRVLKPGGSVGISDLTRMDDTSPALQGLLGWIACIGDAQPLARYAEWLTHAGLPIAETLDRSECLREMVQQIRGKILVAEVMVGLKKLALPGVDLRQVKDFLQAASQAIEQRELGYALLTAKRD